MDTLLVAETERLRIRRFHESDLEALFEIMKKPEVMYAWEHGFTKEETCKWLYRWLKSYREDGYGYFAVALKDSGKLIGQAGLMNSEINSKSVVEIGYIFDVSVWGNGYAIEAVSACASLAFNSFNIEKLYATIRPENTASVNVALKLGMWKTGAYGKTYQNREMLHDIYELDREE